MSGDLIGINVSPWTFKARWALDHHRVPYRYIEHEILIGMPALRLKTRRFSGEVTVPVWVDHKSSVPVVMDSWEIAILADSKGQQKLFTGERLVELKEFNDQSEAALDAARALLLIRLDRNIEGRADALPPYVPSWLRKPLSGVARLGISYIKSEFQVDASAEAKYETRIRNVLTFLREKLRAGGGTHLIDHRLSYADIAMAVVLQGVSPVERHPYVTMGVGMRRCWSTPSLASEFADLLEWRDRLFDQQWESKTWS